MMMKHLPHNVSVINKDKWPIFFDKDSGETSKYHPNESTVRNEMLRIIQPQPRLNVSTPNPEMGAFYNPLLDFNRRSSNPADGMHDPMFRPIQKEK